MPYGIMTHPDRRITQKNPCVQIVGDAPGYFYLPCGSKVTEHHGTVIFWTHPRKGEIATIAHINKTTFHLHSSPRAGRTPRQCEWDADPELQSLASRQAYNRYGAEAL